MSSEAAFTTLLNKMKRTLTYRPAELTVFTDFSLEAGDTITIRNTDREEGASYKIPVFVFNTDWNGAASGQITCTGGKARTGSTSSEIKTYTSTDMAATAEATAEAAQANVDTLVAGLSAFLRQNSDGQYYVSGSGLYALIEDTLGENISDVMIRGSKSNRRSLSGMMDSITDIETKLENLVAQDKLTEALKGKYISVAGVTTGSLIVNGSAYTRRTFKDGNGNTISALCG